MSPPFPSLAERRVGVERGKVLTSDRKWGLGRKSGRSPLGRGVPVPMGLRGEDGQEPGSQTSLTFSPLLICPRGPDALDMPQPPQK